MLAKQVDADWIFAESLRGTGASPLHRQIFGGTALDGRRYRSFFDQRISRVQGEGIGAASCGGALACSTGDRIVRLADDYGTLKIPQAIRLSFLIHEARHAEGWLHEDCPTPFLDTQNREVRSPYQDVPLSGKMACDRNELGPYGIQIVLLRNIAKHCESCGLQVRRVADSYADRLMLLILSDRAKAALIRDASD